MQLKRILAIFLAAALILSAFTVSVGAESLNVFEVGVAAETTTPVSSSPVIYNAGEDVKVTISAVQNTGIDYLRLKVSYEPEALEYVGYTTNELFGVNNLETIQNKNGYLLFTAVLNEVSSATGDMFTINFKTKDSFCGETEVVAQLSNNDESNCMITDPDLVTVVPFVGDSTSFEIHKIDTANGVVTEPTCTEQGYTTYSCANCDMAVIGNYVAANGHTEAEAVEENRVEADCTNNGSYDMVVYCSVCNAELSRESFVIDSHGHSPLDAVEENRVEATCTNNGSYDMVVYCSVCNAELSRESFVIDAHGHSPLDAVEENRVEPTCTNKGSYDMVVYCDICDAELSRENFIIDALGHDTIPHDSKAPTCTEIGWEAYNTCSRCDYTTYVELAALGHDIIHHDAKAPTCTEIGWNAYEDCSRCDYTTYEEIAAHGHTEAEAKVENRVEPTCTKNGSYETVVYCSVCNAELSREKTVLDALGHDTIPHDSKEPTCTAIGWDAYDTCSRCDYTTYNELAALGHNMQPVDAQAATCTAIGWDAYEKCSVCGHTENYNELAALGHDYVAVVTDPTCTEQGYTTHTCSRCNDTYVDTYVDALGHDLVHHDAQAATCTAIGWDAYDTCSRCDYTTYNELAVLGHDYNAVVTAPTCTEQGYTTHTCSRCDSEYVDTYVEATGHSYVDKIVYPTISDKGYTLHTCEICSDSYKDNYVDDLASTDNLFPDTDITAWYYEAVNYTVSTGIMSGYGNGNFGPSDSIQRQDFLVMLARYDGVDLSQYTGRSRFTDVQTGSYYAAAVNWGADKGIVSGYQGGTVFGVGDVITREQLVTFLYRYASYKGIDVSYSNSIRVEAKDKYKDYSQVSDWSLDCVMWALDKHVISGANNGTEILPQGNAERCQVAQIMYNIFNNNVF